MNVVCGWLTLLLSFVAVGFCQTVAGVVLFAAAAAGFANGVVDAPAPALWVMLRLLLVLLDCHVIPAATVGRTAPVAE